MNQQRTERRGKGARASPLSSDAAQPKAKSVKVWIPYLKFSGASLPNGRRKWALSWRTAQEADLRNIWNGEKSLDNDSRASICK